jgi:hypothetical protein
MVPLLFQHPVLWWHDLAGVEKLGLFAVAIGVVTVIVTTWMGVRRWWKRWKKEKLPDQI